MRLLRAHLPALLLVVAVLLAAPSHAQVTLSTGAGLGYLVAADDIGGEGSLGVALEAVGAYRFDDTLSVRLRLGWGLTHFHRTLAAIQLGNGLVSGTASAYAGVTDWLLNGDQKYFMFKLIGAIFAYTFLTAGFALAGVSYTLSPLFATSFLEAGLTAATHLLKGPNDLLVEVGLGGLLYVPATAGKLVPGAGPEVGIRYRAGSVHFGAHMLWSPPFLQAVSAGSRANVYAGGVTVGVQN